MASRRSFVAEPPGAEKPYTEAMLTDKVKKGFYLVTVAQGSGISSRVRCPLTSWCSDPVRSHSTVETTSSTLAGRSPPSRDSAP